MNGKLKLPSPIHALKDPLFREKKISVFFKRDDLIDTEISGNKWRKLKYNIQAAGSHSIITFGGAFSNHIAATAVACKEQNIPCIGVIRGESPNPLNSTLQKAKTNGMTLNFVSREEYRNKDNSSFLAKLQQKFDDPYIIPEGGANALGIKGCSEVLNEIPEDFDYIVSAVGTGATIAGIASALNENQKAIGIVVLKGAEYLSEEINCLLRDYYNTDEISEIASRIMLEHRYHFGGYAKIKPELVDFMKDFYEKHGIKTDPIYSGKSLFALYDMIKNDRFKKGSSIVYYHCGGLQGIEGMENRYKVKFFN